MKKVCLALISTSFLRTFFVLLFDGWTTSAWAVQQHAGAEGLVSHQIGHLLFISGTGYMLFRLYLGRISGPGLFEFKGFLWLIILWNCLTFTGHWMREFVDPNKIITDEGHVVAFSIGNFSDVLFYLTRLDHLVLVPSFYCLLLALKKWSRPT